MDKLADSPQCFRINGFLYSLIQQKFKVAMKIGTAYDGNTLYACGVVNTNDLTVSNVTVAFIVPAGYVEISNGDDVYGMHFSWSVNPLSLVVSHDTHIQRVDLDSDQTFEGTPSEYDPSIMPEDFILVNRRLIMVRMNRVVQVFWRIQSPTWLSFSVDITTGEKIIDANQATISFERPVGYEISLNAPVRAFNGIFNLEKQTSIALSYLPNKSVDSDFAQHAPQLAPVTATIIGRIPPSG